MSNKQKEGRFFDAWFFTFDTQLTHSLARINRVDTQSIMVLSQENNEKKYTILNEI
jgi:hypothetical protein